LSRETDTPLKISMVTTTNFICKT